MHRFYPVVVFLFAGFLIVPAHGDTLHVAVAANFAAPMKELVKDFERESGVRVSLSFGSSGKFFAQIQHGAPFQVLLSADQAKPAALEAAGLGLPGTRFTYAVGRLVLWSAHQGDKQDVMTQLRTGAYHKLAMANPALAPYGTAAIETLEALELSESTRSSWVMGENIAQTYQFVASGNADLGFVALSQVGELQSLNTGSGWIVPTSMHQPIRQDALVLANAAQDEHMKNRAIALLAYLRGDAARRIIESYGYTTD